MIKNTKWLRFRIFTVLVLFLVTFVIIITRAFQLQILYKDWFRERAKNQYQKTIELLPERGSILDRNFSELAVSIDVNSVYARPAEIDKLNISTSTIAKLLSTDDTKIRGKLGLKAPFVWLKRQVDLKDDERKKLMSISGIGLVKEKKRYYPEPYLASNTIGFVGIDSKGLEGIELKYDRYLRGGGEKILGERDALGGELIFSDLKNIRHHQENNIVLTIDRTIQYIAEKEIRKGVENTGARAGIAIVMDPNTGEILAMANYPTIDPNSFWNYSPKNWRNRAVTDSYEPGSIFKIFLLAAAIEEGVASPNDIFYCENGRFGVEDRVFHDVKKHGWLSVANIIKYSSNIGAIKLGYKLGADRYMRYIHDFGFGKKTGIDLPGEAKGHVRHIDGSKVSLATMSFGQGISTTPLQLVRAVSAIANGGFLMKPRLVKSIVTPDGKVVKAFNPVLVKRVLSEETVAVVKDVLKSVTEKGGSGENAALSHIKVAGKTGTAQKPDLTSGGYMNGKYISSFVGFAPADSPKLVVLVLIDEPKGAYYGSRVAAPLFREITKQSLAYMGIYPRDIKKRVFKLVHIDEKRERSNAGGRKIPDFIGKSMRMVLKIARDIPLDLEIVGTGKAVSQEPLPGTEINSAEKIKVIFEESGFL